jgi:threonine/homoserine/homoserine lactone efflux protein
MEPVQLWAFVVFSLVGSFTPGPNTTIATTTAANFGFRAAVPHILGVPFGFSTLLALGTLGVAGLLLPVPAAAGALKWAGIAYLLYLAWLLARAARPAGDASPGAPGGRPLTFLESALFQYANPKAWMLAVATAGTYAGGARIAERTALICSVFALACVVSLVAWAWAGAALRRHLGIGQRRRWFNAVMGGSLAATALWMAVAT